jgi:hypothetical protein
METGLEEGLNRRFTQINADFWRVWGDIQPYGEMFYL